MPQVQPKIDFKLVVQSRTGEVLAVGSGLTLHPFQGKEHHVTELQRLEQLVTKLEQLQTAGKLTYACVPGDAGVSGSPPVFRAGILGALTAGATNYALPDYTESATDVLGFLVTRYTVLRNLRCDLGTAPAPVPIAEVAVVTVLVNGIHTTLKVTMKGVTSSGVDTLSSVVVNEGDRVSFESRTSGGSSAADLLIALEAA